MRQHCWYPGIFGLLGGLAVAGLIAGVAVAAPNGRAVQTEAVIAPGEPEVGGADNDAAATEEVIAPPELDIPDVEYDVAKLPTPVRRMREQIIEAAATGDPDMLRTIVDAQEPPPMFSFGDVPDPIAYLKSLSGDAEGREILAILIEVFEAGYVHVDQGTPDEMYVWPYFARYPVEALTARQMVELFKLVYAGDYEDMKAYGQYTSFRAGIAPDGTWRYFFAGD